MSSHHPNGLVRSLLLAAGRGKRLRPLTDVTPKPVVPLLDVPLAAFALPRLVAAVAPVAMNLSHLAPRAQEALRPFVVGKPVEILLEPAEPFGSGGTVANLRDRLDRWLLTYNSDLLSDIDLAALLREHERGGAQATLAVREVKRGADFELNRGRALRFIDRRERADAAGAMFLGVGVFSKDALDLLPDRKPLGLGESLIAPLVIEGEAAVFRHNGYALDVGTLERYLQASLDVLHGAAPPPALGFPGQILHIDGGFAYRGPGARADDDSIGPGAVLLAGCAVAPGALVENSVVWPGETVPRVVLRDTIWALGRSLLASS